ncbi:MAG: DUF721 domain-containing protein [Chromatiales bacterium]|nr:DUF721 domain-containing protein [Chromatiales bacterium]
MSDARIIDDHISASENLSSLKERALYLRRLSTLVEAALGEVVGEACALARCDPTEVVLVAKNSAWATRARFMAPAVAERFAAHFGVSRVPRVTIRIAKEFAIESRATREPISDRSAKMLDSLAEDMDHPRLQRALRSIARHALKRE